MDRERADDEAAYCAEADSLLRLSEMIRALDAPPPEGLDRWASEVRACRAAAASADALQVERRLEAAALALRRLWLRNAHAPADRLMKAPLEGEQARLPDGEPLAYGYERELDVAPLERRGEDFLIAPGGRRAACVVFSSAQAAMLASLLLLQARPSGAAPLRVAHFGAYFETADLLAVMAGRALQVVDPRGRPPADVHIVEAVACDGKLAVADLGRAAQARDAVVFDATLTGPIDAPLAALAARTRAPLLLRIASGLKLDQAGLELSSVGVLHVLAADPAGVARELRRIRALVGGGLTADQYAALAAPWFLDRAEAHAHARAVFAANAVLARAIGPAPALFAERCHPFAFDPPSALPAPFCALQLREASSAAYRALVGVVEREAVRRGILLQRGGSFGFRGHRYDLIEPEGRPHAAFLRVAMGRRGGRSRRRIVELFAELAAAPSFDAVGRDFAV